MVKESAVALPFNHDVVVLKAHILDRPLMTDENSGLATIFLKETTARTEQGFLLNANGLSGIPLIVKLADVPGLDTFSPPAGGHEFKFRRVPISAHERQLAAAFIEDMENHSAYRLEAISLG